MSFPFLFRCDHDEMVAELKADKVALERELHRLKDLIFKNAFGVQLHDTIPEPTTVPAEEPIPTVAQAHIPPEDEADMESQRDIERLRVIRRNNPSRLGPEMAAVMAKRALRQAEAAHPVHSVAGAEKAKEVFDQARREVS